MFRSRAYNEWIDPYGIMMGDRYSFDGDIDRRSFAAVSKHAIRNQENAQNIFFKHLAAVDTSGGPVTTEIIKFHLVPDMRKKFNKFVKEHGCIATSRTITREEQDLINKTRKSLMQFTSVRVTPEAQKLFLEKNPDLKAKKYVASGSGSTAAGHLTDSLSNKRDANQAELDPPISGDSTSKKAKKMTT